MKCSTVSTTLAVATAALLAVPVASLAQQPSPSPRPSSSMSQPATAQGSAQEHLRQAKSALNEIPAASLTGTTKTRVAELKRHISMLEQSAAGTQASDTGAANRNANATATRGKANWSSEVAAADRILTELLANEPAATGTTGSAKGAQSAAAVTLDDTTRAKLGEVRTHLTAFAAAMSGTASSSAPSSDNPSTPASASAAAPSPAAASPASAPASPAASPDPAAAAAAAPSPQAPPAASPSAPAAPQSPTANTSSDSAKQADTEAVRRHLTAARDTLSQLTQLPAAAQLTGDARTQVSQLISNFNELITTTTEWRASYTKVQANLNALVGDQKADESPAPAAGAAGAVGTSGTVALDPAIRAKLVEFRTHLTQFETAAGGSSASPSPEPSPAAAAQPQSEPAAAAAPTPNEPAPAAAAGASPIAGATSAAGNSATPTATAGTSGRMSAARSEERAEDPQGAKPSPAGASQQASQQHADAMRHIEAIEAILNGTSATGTTGSAAAPGAKPAAPTSLDRAQIEQIRTHLAELKRSLSQAPQK